MKVKAAILFAARCAGVVLAGCLGGLAVGILPCYVFPWFGADARDWCGYKSGPPHLVIQFWLGFAVTVGFALALLLRRRR